MERKRVKKTNLPKGISWREDRKCYMGRVTYQKKLHVIYDKDLKSIKDRMEKLRHELKCGNYSSNSDVTLNEWFDTWIKIYKYNSIKESTKLNYVGSYDRYVREGIGHKKVRDILPDDIQGLFNGMSSKNLSKPTVMCLKNILGSCLNKAVKNRIIQYNPITDVEMIRSKERKEKYVFTVDEQILFIERIRGSWAYDIIMCMIMTGMRSGEAIALRWEDVDMENRTIHINSNMVYLRNRVYRLDTPKTKTSKRTIPMINGLYKIMENRMKEDIESGKYAGSVHVFRDYKGRVIKYNLLYEFIRRISDEFEQKGLTGHITSHTFRHTFATRAIENGVKPQVLKTILGHSNISMTMDLYAHVLESEKVTEMKLLNSLFD